MINSFEMEAPFIPENAIEFAKNVAELAKSKGIQGFTMTLRPSYGSESDIPYARRIHGELAVSFSAIDGRGRPRYKLNVTANTSLSVDILNEPDSFS